MLKDTRFTPISRAPIGQVTTDPLTEGTYPVVPLVSWMGIREDGAALTHIYCAIIEGNSISGHIHLKIPAVDEATEKSTLAFLNYCGWDGNIWLKDQGTKTPEEETLSNYIHDIKGLRGSLTFPSRNGGYQAVYLKIPCSTDPFSFTPPPCDSEPDKERLTTLRALLACSEVFLDSKSLPKRTLH